MVHEKSKPAKRNFLYFLVEEGFRKNTASDRLRDYLAKKFCERAEIEMRYIKLLQGWRDTLAPPRGKQDGAECYMDTELVKRLTTSLKSEAQHTIEARQGAYNCLMAQDGPYSRLHKYTHATAPKDKGTSTIPQLREIFAHLEAKRASTEKEHTRNTEAREHLRHKIDDLESQLSQRSRLTSRRPPTRSGNGNRKVDDMRNRLSSLRHQNEDIETKLKMLEKELETMQTTSEQPLINMDKDLQTMDSGRMKTVITQTQTFLSHLRDLHKGKHLGDSLDINVDSLKDQWVEVQANARRMEVGEQFKLRELFEVIPERPKSRMDGLITKPLASKNPAAEIRTELHRVADTPTPSYQPQTPTDITAITADDDECPVDAVTRSPADSRERYGPSSPRHSESSCSESSDIAPEKAGDHVFAHKADFRVQSPVRSVSEGSIEELFLPPEVICPAELSRLEPNKQYTTKLRLTRPKDRDQGPAVQITEFSQVKQFCSPHYEDRGSDEEGELARQRGVRVIATLDNLVALGSAELPFKKGQVIKQKAGANEDGYCYGWTRDYMLGRKQYGYYRSGLVRLCRPDEVTNI